MQYIPVTFSLHTLVSKYPVYTPRKQSSWGQHGAHLGPVGPRWAPCWPHEPCSQGIFTGNKHTILWFFKPQNTLMTSNSSAHTFMKDKSASGNNGSCALNQERVQNTKSVYEDSTVQKPWTAHQVSAILPYFIPSIIWIYIFFLPTISDIFLIGSRHDGHSFT